MKDSQIFCTVEKLHYCFHYNVRHTTEQNFSFSNWNRRRFVPLKCGLRLRKHFCPNKVRAFKSSSQLSASNRRENWQNKYHQICKHQVIGCVPKKQPNPLLLLKVAQDKKLYMQSRKTVSEFFSFDDLV